MKIIQTPARFYPYTGGVEKYVLDLAKKLAQENIIVKIICADEPKSDIKEYKGIKIKRLAYQFKIANTNITFGLPQKLFKEDFDLLHTHLPTPWSADWSIIIAKLKKKPVVITYHNDIIGQGFAGLMAKIYNATFLTLNLALADRIIITQKEYLNYSPYLKKFKDKIEVITNSVNLDEFKPLSYSKENNSLFFLSVLDEYHRYKGLEYLLKALALVKKEIKDIKLIIGGKGNLENYYKRLAQDLGLMNNVEFHGFIPQEKLVEYFNRYELFILPSCDSRQEGFGIVLLEALACACPVITTDIVGIAQEIVHDHAGLVLKPKNISDLKTGIVNMLKNKNELSIMGKNAQKLSKNYDSEKNTLKFIKLYQDLMAKS